MGEMGYVVHEVGVGPFRVLDLGQQEIVNHIVDVAMVEGRDRAVTAFALHVEGLNHREDNEFVTAMRDADIVYADGGAVVWLAKRAGARTIERAPTTDIGWQILRGLGARLGRVPRLALVGGPPGLARAAGEALAEAGVADPVSVAHGYHQNWSNHLARLTEAQPDVTLVGMGAPREMLWVQRRRHELAPGLVLTCGGWFGFLTGRERRAPAMLRRSGVEWVARLAQAPGRLGPRYIRGTAATAALARSIPSQRRGTAATAAPVRSIPGQREGAPHSAHLVP